MIKFNNVFLHSIAHIEPDDLITSDNIESQLSSVYDELKLPYGRIEMQTGIKSRGIFNALPSQIAAKAGRKLIIENDIDIRDIDLLIHGSVCRDMLEPSTASFIHRELELKAECLSFDLSNACLGVISSMICAAKMIESGMIKNALIVTGENSKGLLENTIETILKVRPNRKEIKKYFANFTIGSAGVALLLTGKNSGALAKLNTCVSLSNTSVAHLCQGGGDINALSMETDSETLMHEGIMLAKSAISYFDISSYQHFICHQVGIMHRNALYKSLGLDLEKDHTSFIKYGNTGSAALPLTLSLAESTGSLKEQDKLLLLGIGSGLHTSIMDIIWK